MSAPETLVPAPRFDWWQALVRVLSSIEAVRDGRALYVMLAAVSGAGMALAAAQASVARGETNWAIGQGAAALFIAFYGANAAGLILMDRALGRPGRDVWAAMEDALGVGHRVLLALAAMLSLLAVVAAGLLGLYALCGLPKVGHWLFALVAPVTVIIIGLSLTAMAAIVAPLAGPTAWAGASAWQSIRTLLRLMRHRLLQAAVLSAGLSVATALVGLACTAFVMVGGWVMAQASVYMLGVDVQPEVLMAGLFGYGLHNISATGIPADAVPYIQAATIGGGVVFALALVIPTLVYLRGVCEIYLALMAADEVSADSLLLARRVPAAPAPAPSLAPSSASASDQAASTSEFGA